MRTRTVLFVFYLIFPFTVLCALDWPGINSYKASTQLPNKFQASGAAWIPTTQVLAIVGDEGNVATLTVDGNITTYITFTKTDFGVLDFEGVSTGPAVTQSENSTLVYVMVEYPATILEIELQSGEIRRTFDLQLIQGKKKRGIEALTFIPETESTGYFYAGSQFNGNIYIYYFDYYATYENGLSLLSLYTPIPERVDISGLCWDMFDEMLWILFDDGSDVFTYKPKFELDHTPQTHQNWVRQHHYSVPGKHQEGIAIGGEVGEYIFLAEDRNERDQQLKRYDTNILDFPPSHDDEDYWDLYYYGEEETEDEEYDYNDD